jgi:hypothetical protein
VLLVFAAPSTPRPHSPSAGIHAANVDRAMQMELARIGGISSAILSATQGSYRTSQFLLDITQGARVSYSAYSPDQPPALSVSATANATTANAATTSTLGAGGTVSPWSAVQARAKGAPQILQPGLLASSIPGGGAYAGLSGEDDEDAVAAADRSGRIAALSLGSAPTLPARIAGLTQQYQLVVTDLPPGAAGEHELRQLNTTRPADQLLIVLERAPDEPGHELLWLGISGLDSGPNAGAPGNGSELNAKALSGREPSSRALTSQTTNQRGLVATVDIAATILAHLDLPLPSAMRGKPISTDGALEEDSLSSLKTRLEVVYGRRLPALACLLCVWALLLLLARSRPLPKFRAWTMRVGALALLWSPVAVLIPAALEPSAAGEYAILAVACFALGALSDRLLGWPRAPLAPALVAVVALSVDALAGTQLLMRSLLGPNPAFGARFYGIGNELKSGLAVLVFAAVAAALYPAVRGRRAAIVMAVAGIALAAIEGSARIGAGVGGVILVSAGTAMAAGVLLPGGFNRRRALTVLLSPLVGLVALAALDLLTAHGSGHFTGSVLHARSAGDVRDIIVRRYRAAWDALKNGAMPYATAFALGAAILGVLQRERLGAPVARDPAWLAALAGGLTAGVIGALTEDSGPVLLVVAVFTLICVLAYLWGRPPEGVSSRRPRRTHAAQSRARTQPEALAH